MLKEKITLFILNFNMTKEDKVQYALGLKSKWRWRDCHTCDGRGKIFSHSILPGTNACGYVKCSKCGGSKRELLPLLREE